MGDRTDIYLEQVTAGLKDDAELRLDVRAELASHLEDKAAELQREGTPEGASHEQAIAALGEPADVATQLALANRRRLNQRAWLRRGLRFALVPAAVLVAILCSDLQWATALIQLRQMYGYGGLAQSWLESLGLPGPHRVSAEFALVTIAILLVPAWLAVREARRRCRELGIACGRTAAAWGLVPLWLGTAAVAVVWWLPPRPMGPPGVAIAVIATTVLILVVTALAGALFLLLADRAEGLYCGTVARSLIPIFAAAMIILCVSAWPALLHAERRCSAADTIFLTGPHDAGFSRLENRVTERLQNAVAEAAASLDRH